MIVMPYTCAIVADKFVDTLNRWGLMSLRVGMTCSSIVDVLLHRFSFKQHRDRWMVHTGRLGLSLMVVFNLHFLIHDISKWWLDTGRWKVERLSTSTHVLFCSVPNPSALSSTSSYKPARSSLRTWQELILCGWLSWLPIITKQMSDLTCLLKVKTTTDR